VPVSSSVTPWTLTMPAGSLQQWNVGLTEISATTGQEIPYPISGFTWEYVVRTSATDMTPGGLFNLTTTPNASGSLTVTSTASLSQVQVTIYPAATSSLALGPYAHALWANPGTTSAFAWVTGQLVIAGNPQP
jgi:hypothetical protein